MAGLQPDNIRPTDESTEHQAPSNECADGSQGETDTTRLYVEDEATPKMSQTSPKPSIPTYQTEPPLPTSHKKNQIPLPSVPYEVISKPPVHDPGTRPKRQTRPPISMVFLCHSKGHIHGPTAPVVLIVRELILKQPLVSLLDLILVGILAAVTLLV